MFAVDDSILRLFLLSAAISLIIVLLILRYRKRKRIVRRSRIMEVDMGPLFEEKRQEEKSEEADEEHLGVENAERIKERIATPEPNNRNVISINLRARRREGFAGKLLLAAFEKFHLESGEMDIFHRRLEVGAKKEVLFSILNGIEPGTLKREDLEENGTSAVILFIRLHSSSYPLRSFNAMVDTAKQMAHLLDGHLYDDQGSNMTEQTLGYYRMLIRDFILQEGGSRKQLNGGVS